ncbi:MAG: 3',5'-cyclic-nucleotide phosphodiesterase [Nitrospirae bacterium]|nr:MAG: 3',5'-cyclic-nucleotide phosphodiesterase [Nitrospirota bacterium]
MGFVINDALLLDAGTAASGLTLEEQQRIRYVVLSHLHLDHIKELPALAVNLGGLIDHQIVVAGLQSILNGLKAHIFNNIVLPDFFVLPTPRRPIFRELALEPHRPHMFGELKITAIPVDHSVPSVGFIVEDGQSSWVLSGDTYATEALWVRAAALSNLKMACIETSFPDEMTELAQTSKHLTPRLLAREFDKLKNPHLPLYAYHLKPAFRERIIDQLAALDLPTLDVLHEGQVITL